jgi:MFS transporter, ceroid-lipofuscinosis neuronal protein 7
METENTSFLQVISNLFFTVVGRRPQGELLGWFASAGSLARLIFPIMAGYIANYSGLATLFFVLTGVLAVSTVIALFYRNTLTYLSH